MIPPKNSRFLEIAQATFNLLRYTFPSKDSPVDHPAKSFFWSLYKVYRRATIL